MLIVLASLLLQIPQAQLPPTSQQVNPPAIAAPAEPLAGMPEARPDYRTAEGLAQALDVEEDTQPPSVAAARNGTASALAEMPATPSRMNEPGNSAPPMFVAKGARVSSRDRKLWLALTAANHGAAVFDAWSTRRAIGLGGRELNPLLRPFAGSGAIYAATQVSPTIFNYLSKRMMRSERGWMRRMWWLPQVAGTAASLASGIHNVRYHPLTQ